MKINSLPAFKINQVYSKPASYNTSSSYITFERKYDSFEKQINNFSDEEIANDAYIKQIVNTQLSIQKELKKNGKAFYKELNKLLKLGAKQSYNGYIPYGIRGDSKSIVTFSDYNENISAPSCINVWEDGKPKSVYNIHTLEPLKVYSVTDFEKNYKTNFTYIEKDAFGYEYSDNDGCTIKQFQRDNGFCVQNIQQTDDNKAILLSSLYYDRDDITKSYYLECAGDEYVLFTYDADKKMWLLTESLKIEE